MTKLTLNKIIISVLLVAVTCFGWVMALTSNLRMNIRQQKLYSKALQCEELEIYQDAVEYLQQAITLKTPETVNIYQHLANVYKKMNYTRQYAKTLKQLIELKTKNPQVYEELALFYYENYQYHDSLNILKQGIEQLNDKALEDLYEQFRYKIYYLFCYYEKVQGFNDGLAPVFKDGKWGYIDLKGNVIIDFKFSKATSFCKNEALVINNEKTAIINKNGFNTRVADFKANDLKGLHEGIGAVKINNSWYLVNSALSITNDGWNDISRNANNLVAICQDDKWGVRAKGGEIIIPYTYDSIALNNQQGCFIGNVNFVKINDKYTLIDINQESISKNSWNSAKGFNNVNSYAAVQKNDKWGFVNNKGEEILPFIWDDAKSFNLGVAAVKINGKWGYISKYGNMVIGAIFDEAMTFNEGLAAVKIDNTWRFIGLEEHRPNSNILLDSLGG